MTTTAIEYVQSKKLEYRIESGQIILKVCPFCGDSRNHFYMTQGEGLFLCHKCQEKGNLITLKKHCGDFQDRHTMNKSYLKPQGAVREAFPNKNDSIAPDEKKATDSHQRLLSDKDALNYITGTRGIGIETVKAFKIGLQIDSNGGRWLTIPHYEKGKLINIKSRTLPPAEKTFRRVKDCRSILFNSDAIGTSTEEIFITEGEIDALTMIDQGIKNIVGVTTGAGSFDPSWIEQLQPVKKIILCYDPDEAGQKGAREAARRLGYDRCFNVVLPEGQDVNEYFQAGHNIFEFQSIVADAGQFDVTGIMSFAEGLAQYQAELNRPDQERGIRTGWADVDRIIKTGFRRGELTILSAPPKIGKSTFALQIVTHNAFHGIPSLFFCLEMQPVKVIQKIMQCRSRRAEIGPTEIEMTRVNFKGKPLYLGFCHQKPNLDGIIKTLKEAIRRYGLKLLAFDHLHFLCRSVNNQVQEIGLAVQEFKFLAEELEVPIILIAQPRKIQADTIMTAMDLKDSSSIFSDCDHLIILHRVSNRGDGTGELATEAYKPDTCVRIEASRYNAGGECLLYFHGDYSRFDPMMR